MTQRVVLAKTLLHSPGILLLDEPASGMDPIARIELKDALQNVASQGATVIVSSHILSELAEMATSIGILHKGRLREHGSVSEVLSSFKQTGSKIEIDILGDREACQQWFHDRSIKSILSEKHPNRIQVEIAGDATAQAELLKDIIHAGFSINGFHARQSSLEDLMRVISSESDDASPDNN
jgi:ABC-2 type transport system ATP-binding protein